jgi:integrase
MAILVECPTCKYRNSLKKDTCKCGFPLKKAAGKAYWIEYYDDAGMRRRERIGPSKGAAEQRLREVLTARAEGRHIQKDLGTRLTLAQLCDWYLDLPEVKAKASIRRDRTSIGNLERLLGENTKIREITAGRMESYRTKRLAELSGTHPKETIRPATVNRDLSCLKTMINRGVRHGKLSENPVAQVKQLPENNVRKRILTEAEFEKLVEACDPHLKPVVVTAYFTAMRRAEVLELTWDEVDLQKGFIRLRGDRTKTGVGRSIPIHPRVKDELSRLPRGIKSARVFLRRGKPFGDCKKSFAAACTRAGIKDFTFHDLRHCAINNLRLAGNDFFRIMALSGHKTMSVFKRYNVVTEEELGGIIWENQAGQKDV